jgi:lipoate-protein ligase B
VNTDRGGQATIHNRGQLVLYPIIPLREWNVGVRQYVDALERATALFLAENGVEVTRSYEPGLWVDDKKIASFGIRVDRGVTLHGVAININNNLTDFNMIKPCGSVAAVTNLNQELSEWGMEPDQWNLTDLANQWLNAFKVELSQSVGQSIETEVDGFEVKNLGAMSESIVRAAPINRFQEAALDASKSLELIEDVEAEEAEPVAVVVEAAVDEVASAVVEPIVAQEPVVEVKVEEPVVTKDTVSETAQHLSEVTKELLVEPVAYHELTDEELELATAPEAKLNQLSVESNEPTQTI